MNAIIEQARSLDGYQDSSELLQRRDQDWVLDRAGIEPRSLLDLGCGIGSLLLGGARRWPGLQRLWGIERSPLRLEQARAQLRGAGVEARLLEGDLLDLPPLAERFELISMTAVLHWLYPDEERLFRWVARHLEAQGVFLFTSHHPFAEDGLGGEDDLVAQALVEMGLAAPERVAALYAEAGLLPMGTRTRGREALRERVERHFRVDSIVSRPAVLRVADSAEYQRFHAATFGTYFAPLVPATRLEEFFVRLGRIAERRMQADGQVSEIPVSVCAAGLGRARHNLMRNRSAARLKIGTGNCTRWHPQPIKDEPTMSNPRSPRLRLVPVLCAVGLACLGQPGESAAEEVRATSSAEIQRFDIPAGELAQVLLSIVRQSRTPIAFDQHLVEGLPAPAIQGSYSVEQALQRALQGSGLEYSRSAAGVLSLQRATAPDAALPAAKPAGTLATVVVTGTRKADVKAGESLAPIDVVSAEQLRDSGSGDLRDALVRLLPSLSRQAQAYNASALTNAQSLRGLSPNHVLVLVNGKRRHETANINVSGGLQSGSTGVDLDTIPLAAIERIEVLRDGASAQYGSDAIAGVINVILKSADHGGRLAYDNGRYGDGDGLTQNGGVNGGLRFGESGFLNLSAQFREQARTIRAGIDQRTGHYGNPSIGDPSLHRQALAYNAGVALDDNVELYSFATYTHRSVSSAQIYQLPSLAPRLYPNGFTPRITSDEDDYSLTLGARGGELFGAWDWDLSSTYGADRPEIGMDHSINLALYGETGDSPRSFDLARYKATQWTNNLDLRRDFDLAWLPAPLNFSWGLEQRRELYEVEAGDPWSYYNGGSKALPGQAPATAGQWSRDVLGAYLDLSIALDERWQLETAARYEHYSDFGSTTNGKLASRYRFSPEVSARASLSSGFRAPSLAQENYTSLGVSPTIASGLLAVNSPAARLLGAEDLEPEKSISYNLGLVLDPLPDLNLAIDAYRIEIRDRIVDGATYSGQPAIDALRAGGISIPAGLTQVSTHYMTNGADTRTHGLDLTASYLTRLGEWGRIDWRLGANVNRTKLVRNHRGRNGQPLLNDQQQAWITSSTPRSQVSLQADWSYRRWGLTLRETRYSKTVSELDYYTGEHAYSTTVFNRFENSPKYITDVALRYAASRNLTLSAGANNLFDVKPDKLPAESAYLGFNQYDTYASQISFNGAFYYLGAAYTF
nr:TonB-dependent receptor [Pseudomonas aeruginosa]EKY0505072.1 TonB-dependent receptor [Pseudomonas aeruginosa]